MNREQAIAYPHCPEWLKLADWEGDVAINEHGLVIFNHGIWHGGTWMNGVWFDGLWEDGTWMNGYWKSGAWLDGEWMDGVIDDMDTDKRFAS